MKMFFLACLLMPGFAMITGLSTSAETVDSTVNPRRVHVTIFMLDVKEINSAKQSFDANVYIQCRWQDLRLVHNGETSVSRPINEVWYPRFQIVNQQKVWRTFPEAVDIAPDGEVVYRQRMWGTFSQPLDLRKFPFDQHVFSIQLVTAGYKPDEIELVPGSEPASGIAGHLSVADWSILDWKGEPKPYKPIPGVIDVAGFTFSFKAKRKIGYFIFKVIIPLVFIVAMSWVVFWIDPKESSPQISVAVTTMLTLIAYRFAVGTFLPKISYLTRLDLFILISTVIVFAGLVEVVITTKLAKSEKLAQARTTDRCSRWLFPAAFFVGTVISLAL
jgi:hypothetical protein